jgi:hypothetical protein
VYLGVEKIIKIVLQATVQALAGGEGGMECVHSENKGEEHFTAGGSNLRTLL